MKINLSGPDITQTEIDAVLAVLKTTTLSLGPKLVEFESNFAEYIGRRFAVAANSGTSALHLSLLALGIGPGDEVITTPFTFIATTNAILMAGADPVLVDIDPDTLNIDLDRIGEKITAKTKALMPVEVFGNPAGIDRVFDLAKKRRLFCIEDSCEALGSTVNNQKAGALGHVSTFAFYPNKQITTGEGGILLTDDPHVARLAISLRNQGRSDSDGWLAHARLGYNYRLDEISCALGIEQLKRIDEIIQKRSRVAQHYQHRLAGDDRFILPTQPVGCSMSWFVYVIRLQDHYTSKHRDQVLTQLRDQGIGCANYFPPVHLQPFMVERFGYKTGDFPITEKIAQRTIALPFHNNLTEQHIDTVCTTLKKILNNLKP